MKVRNHLVERRLQAIAKAARDVPPILDNLPESITAHSVRRLCQCHHCKGLGDREQMICVQVPFHTLCFRQAFGFEGVLALSDDQKGKFRISDLCPDEMRKLLKSTRKKQP
jgi:hypothetical protein